MQIDGNDGKIEELEKLIINLAAQVEQAKNVVQQWTDANSNLARSAADARAENQNAGRGVLGALLGSKFRSAMRSAAASNNASIAKQVAEKRVKIAEAKNEAQATLKRLQSALVNAKQQLKALQSSQKAISKGKSAKVQAAEDSLTLLHKLKGAYDAGILTESEYEEKRSKLIANI